MKILHFALLGMSLSAAALADNSTLDAAIGGGLGGAAGAAIGNELGGRDGAIIGGALGGAAGAAVATEKPKHTREAPHHSYVEYYRRPAAHPHYYHCPPGQAKKGRC